MNTLFRFLVRLALSLGWAGSVFGLAEAPYFSVKGAAAGVDALPLKATDVSAVLGFGFAEVRVVQTYINEGGTELEADYLFPIGVGAAVNGLTLTVGDRRVEAVIKEKGEAKKVFEEAKAAGKTAVLAEAKRPDVVSTRLTRIHPGDTITVELRYTERLTQDEGEFSWAFPTTIGPRYSTSPDAVVPALVAGGPASLVEVPVFSLRADVWPGFPVERLESPSHRIQSSHTTQGVRVEVAPDAGERMDRDFVLRYQLRGDTTQPRLLVQTWRGHTYVAVNWMPPILSATAPQLPRDFLFVIDVSGSMGGFPLETARVLADGVLRELREGDAFNILLFSGSSAVFSPAPLKATPENLARGLAFIGQRGAGGGTELLPALRTALAMPRSADLARTIVVVTDGYVDVEEEAHALVAQHLGDAALFPFGIGAAVNRNLIERLARAGRTSAMIVEDPTRAAAQAARFRSLIDRPLLTDTELLWKGTGQLSPLPRIAPAYAGRPWSFVSRVEGALSADERLVFTGLSATGPFRHELNLGGAVTLPEGPLLAQSWARDRLEEWNDRWVFAADKTESRKAIVDIGLEFNLLTRFTSFVAVDTVARASSGPLVGVTQTNSLPAGMDTSALGGDVPAAPEPATWALLAVAGGSTWWWRRRQSKTQT